MKTRKHTLLGILLVLLIFQVVAQKKRPLEIADMFKIKRVSSPALSPDGEWIVYTIIMPILDANKNTSDLWIISINGGTAHQLTTHPANDRGASWSPDGKWIAFESTRSGDSQIWIVPPFGGEAQQLTNISTEATKPIWSPDGKTIVFLSEVFPEYSYKPFTQSDALNKERLNELKNGKVKAKIFTSLLYRHWDSWVDGKR